MTTTAAGQALPLVFDWPIECGDQTPGNILARRMRYIFEDTHGLFPPSRRDARTVAPNGRPDKYNTTYEVDFNGQYWNHQEFRSPRPVSEVMKKRSKLVRPERRVNSSTVFMNWKIPNAVFGLPEKKDKKDTKESDEEGNEENGDIEEMLRDDERENYEPETTKFPILHPRSVPVQTNSPNAAAQASVPVLIPDRGMTPAYLPTPPDAWSPTSSSGPRRGYHRKNTTGATESQPLANLETSVLNPIVIPRATELLKESNPTERRIIEKALVLNTRSAVNDSLMNTLQPEAAVKVKKLLDKALPEEREVLLKFFHTLSGNKKMSPGEEEKKELVFKVMEAFKRGRASYVSQSHPHFTKGDGLSKLKHMRILTPNSRKNRWMHTTWHHLPVYDEKKHENISSHYERPHRPVPRHFSIHPDWTCS